MIEGLISLASYGFVGGGIGEYLAELEANGFFTYILPFLLIFAIVYGILSQIKIFKDNRGVNGIIALVIGLMALQFDFVPMFFAEVFPRFGIGLAILLLVLILLGFFIDPDKSWVMYVLLGVAAVILLVVLINTSGALGWAAGGWWYANWKFVAGVVTILIIIAIIVSSGGTSTPSESPLAKLLRS
jgi:hypothetical protein